MNDVIDPSARRLVEAARKAKAVSEAVLTPAEARENFRASRRALSPEPPAVTFAGDLSAPGIGGEIPLRLYRGAGTDGEAVLPVLLFFHSGGWVSGGLDTTTSCAAPSPPSRAARWSRSTIVWHRSIVSRLPSRTAGRRSRSS